jgi:hypothetical protein
MPVLPYTRRPLNKKNYFALGFFLHSLVNTPSPIRTHPGMVKG